MLAAKAKVGQPSGHKLHLGIRLPPQDWPPYSNGSLSCTQPCCFKLRAPAAQARIAPDGFEVLADEAARMRVPALQVANGGGCAGRTLHVSNDMTPEAGAAQPVRQITLLLGDNRHASAEEAGIADPRTTAEIVEIAFDADAWKSQ
ncbi:hypothetical protein [Stenotrophomonas acidaminiphila]|uniref:hypothetical protein n=1 Tax=Stenotrophomonas acidaminiphila TaxID=128780 RepID=UPI0015F954F0|nr:hypothetical protein [Stenotrophomonas acidaminiphila]